MGNIEKGIAIAEEAIGGEFRKRGGWERGTQNET